MPVLDDDGPLLFPLVDFIDQGTEHEPLRARTGFFEDEPQFGPQARVGPAQCFEQMRAENDGIVVVHVGRQPRDPNPVIMQLFRQLSCDTALSEAGRSMDEGQPLTGVQLGELDQPWPAHQDVRGVWWAEPGRRRRERDAVVIPARHRVQGGGNSRRQRRAIAALGQAHVVDR